MVLVALLSTISAGLLRLTEPTPPVGSATVTSVTVPAAAYVGERLTVRGSALIAPDRPALRQFSVCHIESSACDVIHRGWLRDPGHWTGVVGSMRIEQWGTYEAIWTLFEPWGVDTPRATFRMSVPVVTSAPR
jgi:hypothetical protein